MAVDLRKLYYFQVVARERNLGRAARQLNIAQPALSRRMRDLEADLGAQLLVRLPRGVALTTAGERLAERVPGILEDVASLRTDIAQGPDPVRGPLRVGHPHLASRGAGRFARLLQAFREIFPNLEIQARLLSSSEQHEALKDGSIELAVRYGIAKPTLGLECRKLDHDTVSAARIGRGHSAAEFCDLSVGAHLAEEPLVIFPRERNPALHDHLVAAARRAGHRAHVLTPTDHASDAWRRGAASQTFGWALVQASEVGIDDEWSVCRPLSDVSAPVTLEICWIAPHLSPALRTIAAAMELADFT